MWEIVYRKYEFQDTPHQEKAIEKKGENQRRQNQGRYLEGQLPLE